MNSFVKKSWLEITKEEWFNNEENAEKYRLTCLSLPKDLKEWLAYKSLKTKIENLKEVPLIIELKKRSI